MRRMKNSCGRMSIRFREHWKIDKYGHLPKGQVWKSRKASSPWSLLVSNAVNQQKTHLAMRHGGMTPQESLVAWLAGWLTD